MDAPGHRFIAFDRPGFGYSERPRDRAWGPSEQARLLLRACARLGIERPVVVGHSWGALVALAMALDSPADVAGLVLLSGYYFPAAPLKTLSAAVGQALPLPRHVVRHMVVPVVRRLMAPSTVQRIFAPCAVPERFKQAYSIPLALRASQINAVEQEAAMLVDATGALCRLYPELAVPVRLIAGSDDGIVDTQFHSARLHRELPGSGFSCVPGCGHMVHHAVPEEVVGAIAAVGGCRLQAAAADMRNGMEARTGRQWLNIGEGLAA
jgi:pimeloyl-ACP methyl ester carboxylesterase